MQFGDFAHHHGAALCAENRRAILQHVAHAVRCLVQHQGARFLRKRLQSLASGGAARRQKPFETEPVRRQSGDRQRRDRRARSRHGNDLEARRRHRARQFEAGIADGGRAGIAHQRHRRAVAQPLDDLAGTALLVVIVQRQLRRVNSEMLEENPGVTRIFGRNQGTGLQYLARPGAQIAEIADRSRDHVQPPRRLNSHYNPCPYGWFLGECRLWQRSLDVHGCRCMRR